LLFILSFPARLSSDLWNNSMHYWISFKYEHRTGTQNMALCHQKIQCRKKDFGTGPGYPDRGHPPERGLLRHTALPHLCDHRPQRSEEHMSELQSRENL